MLTNNSLNIESLILHPSHKIICCLALWLFAFCFISTPASYAQDEKIFNAERFELENGLEIVVIPSKRVPAITHMVWYKVGAADEPRGKSGIAHFLEHLMFKGSDGLAPGEFSEIVRSLGGNDNAFTSQDYTAYFQSIASEHLETVMRMEAGRMRGATFPEEEVKSENKVILEERRQRTDNSPKARFAEQLTTTLFTNHPYGTPVIGWAHEMEGLGRNDAKSFYDRWYGPNNAILIVSGDVTGEQVHKLAKEIYGPLKRIDVPERDWPRSPPLNALTSVTLEDATIRQPAVRTKFRAPSYNQNRNEALALEVLAEIMGGGSTSRLYKSLVIKQKLASSAGLGYRPESVRDATATIYAAPLPEIDLKTVQAAYEKELRLLISDGVSDEELSDATTRMQDSAIYARDSLTGPAMIFGYSLVTGSTIDDVEYWPRDIGNVTAEDVRMVAEKYLNPDKPHNNPPVTGYLLPKKVKDTVQKEAKE